MIVTQVEFGQNATNCIRARVTAPDATGADVPNEDKWIKQADLSGITCTVYDISESTSATISVSVSGLIHDTPLTNWDVDGVGYNFQHLLPANTFPNEAHDYKVVYWLTTTGGNVYPVACKGPCVTLDGNG